MPFSLPFLTMVLFSLWPFVSFLNNNQDDALIYGSAVSLYAVIYVIAICVLGLIGRAILGVQRFPSIAHVLGFGTVFLFSYLPLSSALSGLGISLGSIRIAIWLVLSIIALVIVWRLSRAEQTKFVVLAVAAVMTTIPAVGLGSFVVSIGTQKSVRTINSSATEGVVQRPNVYWFVLDAYAREDVLADYFSFDNSVFIEGLEDRGFEVASQSSSNYASTKLSISTTATMDYYLPVGETLHPAMWTERLQGFSPVVERFRAIGYRYLHAEPGGNNLKTRCGGNEDLCITAEPAGTFGVSEAEVGLLRLTPVFPIIRRLFKGALSFDFTMFSDIIPRITIQPDEPFFLFAHVLSPHPPQRFNRDCSRVRYVGFDLAGEDFSDLKETYINDLKCLNPRTLAAVDKIMTTDSSDPIIILQSDHGVRGDWAPPPDGPPPRTPPELVAFANLHAMRTPRGCDNSPGDIFSPVNTFRIVFACIQSEPPDMLPNRHFSKTKDILDEIDISVADRKQ